MSYVKVKIDTSYSQLCVFSSTLDHPFNEWSERHFTQGFAWRDCSASFLTLLEDGHCEVGVYVDEPVGELGVDVVRAFKVPFITSDGKVEIGSITDAAPLQITPGAYVLQVELLTVWAGIQYANIRFNRGLGQLEVLKTDGTIDLGGELDAIAIPAL